MISPKKISGQACARAITCSEVKVLAKAPYWRSICDFKVKNSNKSYFSFALCMFFLYFAVNVPLLFHGWLPHIRNFLSWRYILMTRRLNGQTKFSQDRQHRSLTCYKKTTAVVVNWWNDGQTEMNNPLPTLKNPGFYTDL